MGPWRALLPAVLGEPASAISDAEPTQPVAAAGVVNGDFNLDGHGSMIRGRSGAADGLHFSPETT
jgi:hypothetical protein